MIRRYLWERRSIQWSYALLFLLLFFFFFTIVPSSARCSIVNEVSPSHPHNSPPRWKLQIIWLVSVKAASKLNKRARGVDGGEFFLLPFSSNLTLLHEGVSPCFWPPWPPRVPFAGPRLCKNSRERCFPTKKGKGMWGLKQTGMKVGPLWCHAGRRHLAVPLRGLRDCVSQKKLRTV